MKKYISMIYRLAFLLFCVWTVLEYIGFDLATQPERLFHFPVFTAIVCFFCILAIFLYSIKKAPSNTLIRFKIACTMLALTVFFSNLTLLSGTIDNAWILKIFLPLMMLLDWLLFDKKGCCKGYDPLLWLAGIVLVCWLLFSLLKDAFGLANPLAALGLFSGRDELLRLLGWALGAGVVLFLLDQLCAGGGKKNTRTLLGLFWRLLFLLLEAWSFAKISGANLPLLLQNLRYYVILMNFICFLCIAVLVIYQVVKGRAGKGRGSLFPRIKGASTVWIVMIPLVWHVLLRQPVLQDAVSVIHYYIAPAFMAADWFLFDERGGLRAYDPLLWSLVPVCYYAVAYLIAEPLYHIRLYPAFTMPPLLAGGGALCLLLLTGYALYLLDRCVRL